MEKSLTKEFGFLRSFLWPIHRHEMRKFLPLFVILFLTCFNYGILRPMKDTLIITASGAKILPFIKVWAIIPIAIALTFFFTKLTQFFSQEKVFYIVTSGFIGFYLIFGFVLYPLRDVLQPTQSAEFLQNILPQGFSGLVDLYRNWTLTLFYAFAELWSSIVLSTLFWSVANEVTPVNQAKRFYGVLGMASNFAAFCAGVSANFMSSYIHVSWNQMVSIFILSVAVIGVMTMALFRWQCKTVLTAKNYPNLHQSSTLSKKKKKPSLLESFKLLSKSKYLSYIAIMVVSYNLVINLSDVIWKDRLNLYCTGPKEFNFYMNYISAAFGLLSLIITIFIPQTLEKFGWTKTAMVTPVAMGITGLAFFFLLLFGNVFGGLIGAFATPLAMAVFFGSLQHCLSKAVKYSLFDTTANMAFIPLDHDTKFQGKAPIDVVGARLGKSGGSLVYQGLLLFVSSISACIPYVAVIFCGMMTLWLNATKKLGLMFNQLVSQQAEAAQEQEAPQEQQEEVEVEEEQPQETAAQIS